jgi:hypothetical protein
LKQVLFNNEYISGVLTTQGSFAQKFGYFEIRAKMPVGQGVNLAMGSKNFQGVGFVDATSPATVAFEIDRISAWQIDP